MGQLRRERLPAERSTPWHQDAGRVRLRRSLVPRRHAQRRRAGRSAPSARRTRWIRRSFQSFFICVANCDADSFADRTYELHTRGSEGRTPWLFDLGANVTFDYAFSVAKLQVKLSVLQPAQPAARRRSTSRCSPLILRIRSSRMLMSRLGTLYYQAPRDCRPLRSSWTSERARPHVRPCRSRVQRSRLYRSSPGRRRADHAVVDGEIHRRCVRGRLLAISLAGPRARGRTQRRSHLHARGRRAHRQQHAVQNRVQQQSDDDRRARASRRRRQVALGRSRLRVTCRSSA